MRLESDYDSDPGRWRSMDRRWRLAGDVHEVVAERIARRRLGSVLDLGCGQGRLREVLPAHVLWAGVDRSPTQLRDCPHRPVVRADAGRLPFADGAFDAVAAYARSHHLPEQTADRVAAPVILTKRGVLVSATVLGATG